MEPEYGEKRMKNWRNWFVALAFAFAVFPAVAWEEPATRVDVYGGEDYKVFLGSTTLPENDPDSIWNEWGKYGSKDSPLSMFNPHGMYGSSVSPYSPWNPYASNLPALYTGEDISRFSVWRGWQLKGTQESDDPRKREDTRVPRCLGKRRIHRF